MKGLYPEPKEYEGISRAGPVAFEPVMLADVDSVPLAPGLLSERDRRNLDSCFTFRGVVYIINDLALNSCN